MLTAIAEVPAVGESVRLQEVAVITTKGLQTMERNADKIKRLEREKEVLRDEFTKARERIQKLEKDLSIACNHTLAINEASEALQIQMVLVYGEEKKDDSGNIYHALTLPVYDVKALVAGYEKSASKNAEKNEFLIVAREAAHDETRESF